MILDVVVGLGAGSVAGLLMFGGLHWTVAHLVGSDNPALVMALSIVARLVVVSAVFLVLALGGLVRILAGVVGLVAVRTVWVWAVRSGRLSLGSTWT